jgi:hypothetical protein
MDALAGTMSLRVGGVFVVLGNCASSAISVIQRRLSDAFLQHSDRCDEEECPRCDSKIQRPIQFKYGDTWQYQYKVDDRIRWGGNDIGERGRKLVIAEGYADECPVMWPRARPNL